MTRHTWRATLGMNFQVRVLAVVPGYLRKYPENSNTSPQPLHTTSTFRDACPSRVRGCRSAIRRLSEFVSEPCPTVSERLRGVRAVARLCLVCEGTPRITSDIQPCPRTCLGCPSVSEHIQPCPRTCLGCPTVFFFEFSFSYTSV